MEYFWVIFENSQVILYSLKQKHSISQDDSTLIDYLLKETRKHLDSFNNNINESNMIYTEINDSLEYTVHKEKMNNTNSEKERVTILVTYLPEQQNYKAQIKTDSSTIVSNIKDYYINFITYNDLIDSRNKDYEKLKDNINTQIVSPYITIFSAK